MASNIGKELTIKIIVRKIPSSPDSGYLSRGFVMKANFKFRRAL